MIHFMLRRIDFGRSFVNGSTDDVVCMGVESCRWDEVNSLI